MTERPVLFRAEMVRAIREGRKTQTRRIVKPKLSDEFCALECVYYALIKVDKRTGETYPGPRVYGVADESEGRVFPFGDPGNRLWVREAWRIADHDFRTDGKKEVPGAWLIEYRADNKCEWRCPPIEKLRETAKKFGTANTTGVECKWRPSIFMPRWASRITLEITSVRVERLQEISEEDAEAEGADFWLAQKCAVEHPEPPSSRTAFGMLWKSIHGKDSWNANPFVWVITFKRV